MSRADDDASEEVYDGKRRDDSVTSIVGTLTSTQQQLSSENAALRTRITELETQIAMQVTRSTNQGMPASGAASTETSEVDQLRAQVANLTRENTELQQTVAYQQEALESLQAIVAVRSDARFSPPALQKPLARRHNNVTGKSENADAIAAAAATGVFAERRSPAPPPSSPPAEFEMTTLPPLHATQAGADDDDAALQQALLASMQTQLDTGGGASATTHSNAPTTTITTTTVPTDSSTAGHMDISPRGSRVG